MPANQCGSKQCQRPLSQALLMTASKDMDPRHASKTVGAALTSRHLIWNAHSNSESILAATLSADSKSGRLDPLGSPLPVLTVVQPAHGYPAANARRTTTASPRQSAAAGALLAFIRRALP
jgi:hypothetical protein